MNVRKLAFAVVAIAATLGAGLAEARGRDDVQWSVTIGHPAFAAPPLLVYDRGYPQGHRHAHRSHRSYRDADRDGIPNRFDRVYNPRWDRDGDGVPNRYDRVYNPRWDRDGDGVPNRYDRHDKRHHHDARNGRGH